MISDRLCVVLEEIFLIVFLKRDVADFGDKFDTSAPLSSLLSGHVKLVFALAPRSALAAGVADNRN